MTKPVALTSGDPASVSPEITFAAWAALRHELAFFLIADRAHMTAVGAGLGQSVVEISGPEDAADAMPSGLPLLHQPLSAGVTPGEPDLRNAAAVVASIDTAVDLALSSRVSAVCTNPISKKVLVDGAGFSHPGHTEYLAAKSGAARAVMMLVAPELRVVPATIHIPLTQVVGALTGALLDETLAIMNASLRQDFGLASPRIAVSGLNPHAGEGGLMGDEDDALIAPAVARARASGIAATGPLPADTMFHPAARDRYDAALCMYHDQALIPIKTLNFSAGVNMTLGLPFVRTSPDHGTAFDIAGKAVADPQSLIEALRLAAEAGRRRQSAA